MIAARSKFRHALLAGTFFCSALSASASAQTPQEFRFRDENGIDLVYGDHLLTFEEGSIGSGSARLALIRHNTGPRPLEYDQLELNISSRQTMQGVEYRAVVQLPNGAFDTFVSIGGGTFTSTKANGGSLTGGGSSYGYRDTSGRAILFSAITEDPGTSNYCLYQDPPQQYCSLKPTSITDTNGSEISLSWDVHSSYTGTTYPPDALHYARLNSISNNFGYSIIFEYPEVAVAYNSPPPPQWWNKQAARLYRGESLQGTVGYAYPASATVDITDMAGKVWRVAGGSITAPGASAPFLSVTGPTPTKRVVTRHGVTTNYDRTVNGDTATMVVTNALNQTMTVVSDLTRGRPSSITDWNGRTTTYAYDASKRITTITAPGGHFTEYVLDSRGNATEVRRVAKPGSGGVTLTSSAAYPATCDNLLTCNSPTSTTDPAGRVTDYSYSTVHGGVTETTLPAAPDGKRPKLRYDYTQQGQTWNLTRVATCRTTATCAGDADETVTTLTYDGFGNLTASTTAAGDGGLSATVTAAYNGFGDVVSVDGPLPGTVDTTAYRYDPARRLVGIVGPDPDGAGAATASAVRFVLDDAGRVVRREKGSVAGPSDVQWNAFDRSAYQADLYDGNGRVQQTRVVMVNHVGSQRIDVVAALTETTYDALGRVECVIQRLNASTLATAAPAGCVVTAAGSDGADRITRTEYNAGGQVTAIVRGDKSDAASRETYAYHADGTVGTVTDGKGNVTAYTYDGFGRPERTCYQTTSSVACAGSPGDYEQVVYATNGDVHKRRLRDGRELSFSYDGLGRLSKKTVPDGCPPGQSTGCPAASATRDVDYGYDLLGHLTSATFSGTSEGVSATYDALGRMTGTTTTMGGTSRTLTYVYDAAGNRTRLTHPDGIAFGYERDAIGRNTRVTETVGTTTREVLNLAYYANGNRSWFGHGANGRGHGYDPLGRLTGYNLQRNQNGTVLVDNTTLEYSSSSQIKRQERTVDDYAWTGAVNVDRPYTTNGLNQYTAAGPATFEYDKNGNLTKSMSPAGGTQVYGYDAENRLVSGPNGVALTYDPLGRLFEIAQNGTVASRFVYDGDALVLEYDGAGNRLQRHVHLDGADTPVLSYHANETSPRQLMPDHQGSIVSMTQHGWSRIAVNTYDEYGYPGSGNNGRFQYTGQAWIAELGLYYYKARMYSPGMGRFLQTDPIGYADGINWYNYVGGDPVNKIDPSGTCEITIGNTTYTYRIEGSDNCNATAEQVLAAVRSDITVTGSRPTSSGNAAALGSGSSGNVSSPGPGGSGSTEAQAAERARLEKEVEEATKESKRLRREICAKSIALGFSDAIGSFVGFASSAAPPVAEAAIGARAGPSTSPFSSYGSRFLGYRLSGVGAAVGILATGAAGAFSGAQDASCR